MVTHLSITSTMSSNRDIAIVFHVIFGGFHAIEGTTEVYTNQRNTATMATICFMVLFLLFLRK